MLRRGSQYIDARMRGRIWQQQRALKSEQVSSPQKSRETMGRFLSDVNKDHKEEGGTLAFAAQVFENSDQPHIAIASAEEYLMPFMISKGGRIEYVGQDSESEDAVSVVARRPDDALLVLVDRREDAEFESLMRLRDGIVESEGDFEGMRSAAFEARKSGVVGLLDLNDNHRSMEQVGLDEEKSSEALKQERRDRIKGGVAKVAIAAALGTLLYFAYKENAEVGPEDMPPAPEEEIHPYEPDGSIRDLTILPHD